MDLQTENRIATILLIEASELRRRAEKEGVDVYLRQQKPRGRPNSRFLTATVLGVQQANRAVEENEMWRARQKERELDDRLKGRSRDRSSSDRRYRSNSDPGRSSRKQFDTEADMSLSPSCSSRKRSDEGLKDDEIEQFLHSRTKRGRGAVGSRMDETGPYLPSHSGPYLPSHSGPYLPSHSDTNGKQSALPDVGYSKRPERRVVLGPEKPDSLLGSESSNDESSESSDDNSSPERKRRRRKSSSKRSSRKHRSEDRSRDKEKKKKKSSKEKRHKHRK